MINVVQKFFVGILLIFQKCFVSSQHDEENDKYYSNLDGRIDVGGM